MALWSRAPLSLRAYVALTVGSSLVFTVFNPSVVALALTLLQVVISYFLLRGVQWLWLVITAFAALSLVAEPFLPGGPWYLIVLGVVQLILLLAPDTRRYFASPKTSAS